MDVRATSDIQGRYAKLLAACGVLSVLLIGGQFYSNIYKQPLLQLQAAKPEEDPNAALKAKDTDKDGISDYDEANVYFTSAYLADSDSDGQDDKTEITKGQDPNCPQGRECRSVTLAQTTPSPQDLGIKEPEMPQASAEIMQNLSIPEIRALLIANGLPKAQVDKLTDQEITTLYQSTLAKLNLGTEAPKATPTPQELRKALAEQGVPQATVDAYTDAQLQEMIDEAMKQ